MRNICCWVFFALTGCLFKLGSLTKDDLAPAVLQIFFRCAVRSLWGSVLLLACNSIRMHLTIQLRWHTNYLSAARRAVCQLLAGYAQITKRVHARACRFARSVGIR